MSQKTPKSPVPANLAGFAVNLFTALHSDVCDQPTMVRARHACRGPFRLVDGYRSSIRRPSSARVLMPSLR